MSLLFDTNIFIDYLRNHRDAIQLLEEQTERPSISVASIIELFAGAKNRQEEQRIERLIGQTKPLPVTAEIGRRAGALVRVYSASHSVEPMDAIIAATAEHHGLRLATLNVKHFPMFPKLRRAY